MTAASARYRRAPIASGSPAAAATVGTSDSDVDRVAALTDGLRRGHARSIRAGIRHGMAFGQRGHGGTACMAKPLWSLGRRRLPPPGSFSASTP